MRRVDVQEFLTHEYEATEITRAEGMAEALTTLNKYDMHAGEPIDAYPTGYVRIIFDRYGAQCGAIYIGREKKHLFVLEGMISGKEDRARLHL